MDSMRKMAFGDLWEFWRKTCLFMSFCIIDNSVTDKFTEKDINLQFEKSAQAADKLNWVLFTSDYT